MRLPRRFAYAKLLAMTYKFKVFSAIQSTVQIL